ncbi:MAG: 6-bladed beta-propeller, partial [Methanospirillum sp.]
MSSVQVVSAEEGYSFEKMWRVENPQFDNAHGIATDSAGNVYVADTDNNRIQKFTSDGTLLASLGVGRLINPYGVAVDTTNNVYVADTGGHRIQKFRSDGTFVATWGTQGSGDGEFAYPSDLAVDSAGNVYVTDTDNNRVQKFAPDGTLITQWGTVGSEDSQLAYPRGIAVDTTGNVYVADTGHGWLKKFASDGTFLLKWVPFNPGDKPNGVSVDTAGRVYVTTEDNDLWRFTSTGESDTTFKYIDVPAVFDRGPSFVYDVASDNAGNFYLLHNSPAGDVSWVGQYSSTGYLITEWGRTQPYDIAADGPGNVYVMDSVHTEIVKFSSTGTRLASWGGEGSGVGQFKGPQGIAVDRAGNVYVADAGNHRVQKFTADGNFTLQWPGQHKDTDQNNIPVTSSPQGITVDSAGFVYIANLDQFVQKYAPNGVLVTEFLS